MSVSVKIRMYNQQDLGDCFLLSFVAGQKQSFLLIDFGSYSGGNAAREKSIAQNIMETVGNNPLKIVLTHQHKDHLTGFISAASIFQRMNIEKVWFSYLDNPTGPEATIMRKETENFWKKNAENKKKVKKKFSRVPKVREMLAAKEDLDLFAEQQTGGQAISNLLNWCKNDCEFLVPGANFDFPGLPADTVKVYVLGPPTDPKLLRKLDPSKSEAVHSLNSLMQLSELATTSKLTEYALDEITGNSPSDEALNFPFQERFSIPKGQPVKDTSMAEYTKRENGYRRIDHDWLSEFGRMSLHMDTLTNNSSLVLAFELVKSKKVLLFVGDAQIGNWKSWFGDDEFEGVKFKGTEVKPKQLLQRTVLYKAGHHSSHNATLLQGLDLMNEKDLVIMIPVNEDVSKNRFAMLKPGMMKGYNRKSEGRVLRADTVFHKPNKKFKYNFNFASKKTDFKPALKVVNDATGKDHLYVEYEVNG